MPGSHARAFIFSSMIICLVPSDAFAEGAELPATTNHSTAFYATQTTAEEGDIQTLASHKVTNGAGRFEWRTDTLTPGDYLVLVNYSSDLGDVRIDVDVADSNVTATLGATPRVFPETDDWYQRSFDRMKLPGSLSISDGSQQVRIRVDPASADDTVAIRALELIPLANAPDARDEIERAEAARPDTDWFSDLRYGLMFHWTSQAAPRAGASQNYATAVAEFNVQAFVQMVASTGADYIIFTTNHAAPHFPAPLSEWEKLHPGQTTERDLVRELADELDKHDIALILYFATHIYADLEHADRTHFTDANVRLLSEVGERYGRSIAGFWLDGWYQAAEKYGDLPYKEVYRASKAGNADRLLALNSWIYPIVTPWQDYWAGETFSIPTVPSARIIDDGPGTGLRYHALLALEGEWVHTAHDTPIPAPVLDTGELLKFINASAGKGPVTLNVLIYQDGTISEPSMNVLRQVRAQLSTGSN